MQNFLSVRNTLYSIWETHRLIVKEQEEMKFYNENDDKSDVSSSPLNSPVSPVEKVALGRIGSGLLSSIQKQSEERGITSPITLKPLFTTMDIQESDATNDVGPAGTLVSENKPWYEEGSLDIEEHLPAKPAAAKEAHPYFKNSKMSNYKRREHIYESIDDVLAELKQNQGSSSGSSNYATLHKWTRKFTGTDSTSSSSSVALDSKNSSSQVSSKSTDDGSISSIPLKPSNVPRDSVVSSGIRPGDSRKSSSTSSRSPDVRDSTSSVLSRPAGSLSSTGDVPSRCTDSHNSVSSKPTGDHDSTNNIPSRSTDSHNSISCVSSSDQHGRPGSGKEQKSRSYSGGSAMKTAIQDGQHTPPAMAAVSTTVQPHLPDNYLQTRHNNKLSFPEGAPAATVYPTHGSPQVQHTKQPSVPELHNTSPGPMVRSHSARWVRRQSHQPGRSQSPTTSPSLHKDSHLTMHNTQNGVRQHQMSTTASPLNDDYNPLAEKNSISMNFSNEVLSIFNFPQLQQQQLYPTEHSSRTASSSSTSGHGRRSVPLKPSPSPDLCVNPLGGPRISPPLVDNQASTFSHVPRRQNVTTNLSSYKGSASTGEVASRLSTKRPISSSQNNLLSDNMLSNYHAPGSPAKHRNSLSYQTAPMIPSPNMMRRESDGMMDMLLSKREIVDCPNSPRFPRRSPRSSIGQNVVYKGTNAQISQPRVAKFTAPPPPTVAPPKLHQQHYSPDFRPPMSGHVRSSKVEQTWC